MNLGPLFLLYTIFIIHKQPPTSKGICHWHTYSYIRHEIYRTFQGCSVRIALLSYHIPQMRNTGSYT